MKLHKLGEILVKFFPDPLNDPGKPGKFVEIFLLNLGACLLQALFVAFDLSFGDSLLASLVSNLLGVGLSLGLESLSALLIVRLDAADLAFEFLLGLRQLGILDLSVTQAVRQGSYLRAKLLNLFRVPLGHLHLNFLNRRTRSRLLFGG